VKGEVILKIFIIVSIMIFLLSSFSVAVFAGGNNRIGNPYFSIKLPDNWTYIETSNTPEAKRQSQLDL
jgi:energy-coupling factor transporter transmembrane protein EcfT